MGARSRHSAAGFAGVDGCDGDGLRPPARTGALGEEAVDELVVEPPRVDGGLGRAGDLPEAQRREPRSQCATQLEVGPLLARPCKPLLQTCAPMSDDTAS
jgi:hypothetical protein